jgi:hypothetical protein
MKHFLIFRKNIQCRTRWMINRAANIKLVLLCMVTHWLRVIPRYVDQLLPRPPPEGRTKYKTSPEIRDGIKVMRHPISTSALMVIRFIKISSGVFEGDRNNKHLV